MFSGHKTSIVSIVYKSRGKGAEKTLHDDFVLICIHLTATSESICSCFELADHSICT